MQWKRKKIYLPITLSAGHDALQQRRVEYNDSMLLPTVDPPSSTRQEFFRHLTGYSWTSSDVRNALSRLSDRERDILSMIYDAGKKERHIGALLGLTQGAISLSWRRAVRKLMYWIAWPTLPVPQPRYSPADLVSTYRIRYHRTDLRIIKCLMAGITSERMIADLLQISQSSVSVHIHQMRNAAAFKESKKRYLGFYVSLPAGRRAYRKIIKLKASAPQSSAPPASAPPPSSAAQA